jgi:outer membrane autotransporter protein
MMNMYSEVSRAVILKKAVSFWVPAFFLCSAATALSQTNTVLGTAFGTNVQGSVVSSVTDSYGFLTIGDPATTSIVLSNRVDGTIKVESDFDTLVIDATGGTLTSSTNMLEAALQVTGGTNLQINGGTFLGNGGLDSINLPPIPGQGTEVALSTNATEAGSIQNVGNAVISGTRFEGTSYAPEVNFALGTDGLMVGNTMLYFSDDGTNSSVLTGGEGISIHSSSNDTFSVGGRGLFADNGAWVTVSNGTFSGGISGAASTESTNTSYSAGGDGIRLENAAATVLDGSFNGGSAGAADNSTGGSGLYAKQGSTVNVYGGTFAGGNSGTGINSRAGHGIFATNSTLNIYGGLLAGGSTASATSERSGSGAYAVDSTVYVTGTNTMLTGGDNAAGLFALNSDVTVDDGTFTGGAIGTNDFYGMISQVDSGQSRDIILNGGDFSSINFTGVGTHYFTAGTNLTVQDYIVVDDATVGVNNLSTAAFHTVFVRGGSLSFSNGFMMASGHDFSLLTSDSQAFFTELQVGDGAELFVNEGQANADTFGLESGGLVSFTIVTGSVGTLAAGTAIFETNSTVAFNLKEAGFSSETNDVIPIITSGGLFVVDAGGVTNSATATNLNSSINVAAASYGRTGFTDMFIDGGNNLGFRFATAALKDYWNTSGQMTLLADELDMIGNAEMLAAIDSIDDPAASAAMVEQTYFTTHNTLQTSLMGLQAAVGQNTSRSTEFREQLKLIPVGARGPARRNDIRGWGKYYGNFQNYEAQGLNSEYDTRLHGGVIGADMSLGKLMLGLSGGGGKYNTQYDSTAEEEVTAFHGSVYGTYGLERLWFDAGFAYGFNQVTSHTADPFRLDSEFDAQLMSGYFGAGYDLSDPKGGTVFTPEASVQYSIYEQEAYTETGTAAVPRSFDEFDADSLRSSLGLNVAMLDTKSLETFGFKIDGRFHWLHEFNPDPGSMSFSLVGGSNGYQLSHPQLEEDLYRVGISATFFNTLRNKPKNVLLRLDFDELFNENMMSHNVAAKIVYAF